MGYTIRNNYTDQRRAILECTVTNTGYTIWNNNTLQGISRKLIE